LRFSVSRVRKEQQNAGKKNNNNNKMLDFSVDMVQVCSQKDSSGRIFLKNKSIENISFIVRNLAKSS
jgi:hypothetical protein